MIIDATEKSEVALRGLLRTEEMAAWETRRCACDGQARVESACGVDGPWFRQSCPHHIIIDKNVV